MRGVRSASQSVPLVMSPLAPLENKDLQASTDWNGAIGNLENARVVADTLKALVHDAVFLDDDAYTNAQTLTIYQQRLQASNTAKGFCPCGHVHARSKRGCVLVIADAATAYPRAGA
jgi:hypothetical protein